MTTELVIGGTGGVGQAVVRRGVAMGRNVAFTYFRAHEAAAALQAACSDGPGQCRSVRLDLRRPEAIRDVVESCGDDLHGVVFAAASGVWRPLDEISRRHWNWTVDINARGLLLLYQATKPTLASTGGSMVIVTSFGGEQVIPAYGLIGMTKSMTDAFVRYAAVESGAARVRVNAVSPGLMETKALRAIPTYADEIDRVAAQTPLGRIVEPGDVADTVEWLLSPAASMITGQTITIDGGWALLADPAQLGRLSHPTDSLSGRK